MNLNQNIINFNRLLIEDVTNRLTGAHREYDAYYGDWPSDKFPAGNLMPALKNSEKIMVFSDRDSETSDIPQYMRSSFTPSSIGLAIYVKALPDKSYADIEGHFDVFEIIAPERTELLKEVERLYGVQVPDIARIVFPKRFARRSINFDCRIDFNELEEGKYIELDTAVEKMGDDVQLSAIELTTGGKIPVNIDFDDFATEERYQQYLKRICIGEKHEWKFQLQGRIKRYPGYVKIDIFLINRTENFLVNKDDDPFRRTNWLYDPFFFGPSIRVKLHGTEFAEVPLPEILESDYRYATCSSATGRNCHANVMKEAGLVITEILPISKQPKTEWVARVPVNFFSYEVLATKDPRPLLKDMATKMRNYLSEWDGLVRDYSGRTIDQIGSRGLPEQVRKSKEAFVDEIERFERGIKSLDDDEVRLAFQLMNMSFFVRNSKAEPENISWRSFQLAFIVSILPDILTREQNNSEELTRTMPATVLWLPTGAGKTEAFTGVILVQAFYDRIRGKDGGVSAVLKFPLRFLSMQQLERAVMAATAANKVLISRKGDIDASRRKRGLQRHEYDQFSVGYFVGSGGRPNDPNKVLDSGLSAIEEIRAGMKSADRFKFISVCPDCQIEGRGTNSIELKGDTNRNRIYHICKKCGREVPLYITDVEVFARLPTMVISTIDKWATISTIPESKTIFGIVRSRCPTHGYSCFDDKCMFLPRDKRCSSVNKMPALYDGPPSIMVQDELHMLGESLGALASQYETFLKNLAGTVGSVEGMSSKGQWKIIASTATIAGYERHMKSMYLKDSDIFPVKGPSASQSFYFSHNKEMAQRLIVGFVPHSMTHPNAVIKTLQYFHAFVKRFEQEPGKLAKDYPSMFARLTPTEESNLFKLVRTSLMYGIVKSETYQILNSVEDQIDPYLKSVGIKDGIKETADVTGDTDPQDNIELLQKMKDPSLPSNPEFIVATSSISHGVDIRQLNFMTFRGQPRSVAEYIQAMSRVGRKYQGIVFAIYNPNRERDASHYMLHNEFLSIADVLISPPAVDRFSRQAVDKSADGIIMGGMMFRERDKRLIRASEFVARQRDPKFLTGLKQFFISSYLPAGSESMVPDFDSFERYVSDTFDVKIRNAVNLFERGRGIWTPELFDCLQNLRKTDEEVDLFLTDPDVQERVSEIKRSSLVVKK